MPYVDISVTGNTVRSSVSIAFGTYTDRVASTLTVRSYNDNGTINTSDNTSVISIAQQGIGSVIITSSVLTVASGVQTTTIRGKESGNVSLIATSPNKDSGTEVIFVSYNSALYADGPVAGGGVRPSGGGGGAGGELLRDTIKINNQTLYRIILWESNTTDRGRGNIAAVIHDAKNVGVSSYLNEGGELFFTLPFNHPQITECVPLERHYRVDRFDEEAGRYITLGQGLLEDYEATAEETVFYGLDYMMVLTKTITTPTTTTTLTYNDKTFKHIYIDQMTQAVNAADSRLGFIDFRADSTGWSHLLSEPLVINAATTTYDIFTGGESRGLFLSNVANIAMEGNTSKIVFGNTLESDTEVYNGFFCDMNWSPTPNSNIVLEYGGNVKSFLYSPNFRSLITKSLVVATNIYNAISPSKIWSSVATGTAAPTSTYGVIEAVSLEQDIVSQAEVDRKAKYRLYQASPEKIKMISVAIRDGSIIPYKRYRLGDDIKVRIQRGNVNLDTYLTLRGQRYFASTDGTEELWFDFFPRDTVSFTDERPGKNKPPKKDKKPGTPKT